MRTMNDPLSIFKNKFKYSMKKVPHIRWFMRYVISQNE